MAPWRPDRPKRRTHRVCGGAHREVEHTWADRPGSNQGLMGRCARARWRRLALRRHKPGSTVQSALVDAMRQTDVQRAVRDDEKSIGPLVLTSLRRKAKGHPFLPRSFEDSP